MQLRFFLFGDNRYTPSEDQSSSDKRGKRIGIAYELENGEIIYVPE